MNNQQIYNSNGLYEDKSCISNNFKEPISEYKGVLYCEGYDFKESPDENMNAHFSEPFFTRRMKTLSRPNAFMLYRKRGLSFFILLKCCIQI